MVFIAPIAKDKLATTSDDDLRQIDGKSLTGSERDEDWDKAFEVRVSNIPAVSSIVNDLKNPGIANDRSKDKDILNRYAALLSDVERIGAFNAGTRVEQSQIEANKPRLKAIFMFLGPEFQKAYKRAKDGQAIRPFKISALLRADREVKFVKPAKR
jgi:hypothetical protein